MYLFSRSTRLTGGNGRAGMEWAISMTEKVRQISGLQVDLWSTVYSEGFGTVHWTAWLPDLQTLETAGDKLMADDGYIDLGNEGAKLTDGVAVDKLGRLLYGDLDPDAGATYVSGVDAVCTSGNLAAGGLTAVGIAQKFEEVSGEKTLVLVGVTGPYGAVSWLTGYADIAAAQAANEKLADPAFVGYLDAESKGLYAEDSSITRTTMYRKVL